MNWFPVPPTDNLYKFLAILGSWGLLFVFGTLLILSYQNYEHEEFNKERMYLSSEEDWLRRAEARLSSLKDGHSGENAIPEISNRFSPKEELVFLSKSVALSQERRTQLKEHMKQPPRNDIPFLAYIRFQQWLPGALLLIFACFYFGFRQWYVLQRTSDELLKLDLLLKKSQLKEVSRLRFRRDG